MKQQNVYTENPHGQKVWFGTIYDDKFIKRKAHLMRISQSYGIQRTGLLKPFGSIDMQKYFREHPDLLIRVDDADTGEMWFSKASDWIEHASAGNYGNGKQMFLGTKYMRKA